MIGKFNKILVTLHSEINIKEPKISEILENLVLKYRKNEENQENIPTIFIRDRKADNRLRSLPWRNNVRIVQFRVDENQNVEERNQRIFKFNLSEIIIFTKRNTDNSEGLQSIQFLAYKNKVPLTVIYEDMTQSTMMYPITEIPKEDETHEPIPTVKSSDYQKKMYETTKKIRKIYYDGLKNRSKIKMIDNNDELGVCSKNINILSKSKKKKNMTKKQQIRGVKLTEEIYE